MNAKKSPVAFLKQTQAMLEGFQADFPPSATEVILGGQKMTLTAVHERLQGMLDLLEAVNHAQHHYSAAVATRRVAMPGFRGFYADAVVFAQQQLGRESARLYRYGIAPPRARRALTSEQKLIAIAKAAATRRARRVAEAGGVARGT